MAEEQKPRSQLSPELQALADMFTRRIAAMKNARESANSQMPLFPVNKSQQRKEITASVDAFLADVQRQMRKDAHE